MGDVNRASTRRRPSGILATALVAITACTTSGTAPTALRSDRTESTATTVETTTTTTTIAGPTTTTAPTLTLPGQTVPPATGASTPSVPAGMADWTVMVYLAADNNLEEAALFDLQEMLSAASPNMHLLALVDRAKEGSAVAGYTSDPFSTVGDWVGAKILEISPSGVRDLAASGGDLDMTDPAVLEQFLVMGLRDYPSEHTALFLWDHAAGWLGFAQDESLNPYNTMVPDQVASAISRAQATTGHGALDVVVFDACLMANLEVAATLSPVADLLIASEEYVPGHGADYSVLDDALSADPLTFATTVVDGFYAQSQEWGDDTQVTMSVIDLQAVPALMSAVDAFSTAASATMATDAALLSAAVDRTLMFGSGGGDPSYDFNLRDLGQLVTSFASPDATVAQAAAAVDAALSQAVLLHTEGSGFTGARGLSVYFPTDETYYDEAGFTSVSTSDPWAALLAAYYSAGSDLSLGSGFGFLDPANTPTATYTEDGVTITANLTPSAVQTISSASVVYGFEYVDSTTEMLIGIGEVPAGLLDASTGLIGASTPVYNLALLSGENILIGYYRQIPNPDGDATLLSVPVLYFPPGVTASSAAQQAFMTITLAADGSASQVSVVAPGANGAYGALAMDPAGTLQTQFPAFPTGGAMEYISSGDIGVSLGSAVPSDLSAIEIFVQTVRPSDQIFVGDTPLGAGVIATDVGGVTIVETALVPQ